MKNIKPLYKALIATAGMAVVAIIVIKKIKRQKIRRVIADAGYETAHDIHFPLRENRLSVKRATEIL